MGYSIVEDEERPAGLRLLEWVRGYIVLKEIAKARTQDQTAPGDAYAIRLEEAELVDILQACGLKDDAAAWFIALTSLHRSARDMFDCPLVRVGASSFEAECRRPNARRQMPPCEWLTIRNGSSSLQGVTSAKALMTQDWTRCS